MASVTLSKGVTMWPKHIPPSEINEFNEMLPTIGRRPNEFDVAGTPLTIQAPPGEIGGVENSVTVTFLPTGKSRIYTRGSLESTSNGRPAWVNMVAQDISNRAFD